MLINCKHLGLALQLKLLAVIIKKGFWEYLRILYIVNFLSSYIQYDGPLLFLGNDIDPIFIYIILYIRSIIYKSLLYPSYIKIFYISQYFT